jgi:hypothetical protein
MNNIIPEIGMGATECIGSDRYPYTIVRISDSGKTFWMQGDEYKRIDKNGLSEIQEYEYTPNTNATIVEVRRAKNGRWYTSGGMAHGTFVNVGVRRAYWDPSF